MKLNRIHAIIGLLLVIVPFMGFTREFKYGFSVLSGTVLLYFAITSIHIELKKKHRKPHRHDTFVESKPIVDKGNKPVSEEEQKPEMLESVDLPGAPTIPSTSHIADESTES